LHPSGDRGRYIGVGLKDFLKHDGGSRAVLVVSLSGGDPVDQLAGAEIAVVQARWSAD
jgi:flagellar biosynthesis/type III secretory pathway ATPase